TAANIRRGMSPELAKRAAALAFGGRERFKDDARDEYRSRATDEIVRDLRDAYRGIRRTPLFATVAATTLGLSLAACTFVFSAVHAVLLRALPYPDADRLVLVWGTDRVNSDRSQVSFTDAADWRRDVPSLEELAVFNGVSRPILSGAGAAERVPTMG